MTFCVQYRNKWQWEFGLELNEETTKYVFMLRRQTAGQNHYMKAANKSFEMLQSSDVC
jgi:hypothetical protein